VLVIWNISLTARVPNFYLSTIRMHFHTPKLIPERLAETFELGIQSRYTYRDITLSDFALSGGTRHFVLIGDTVIPNEAESLRYFHLQPISQGAGNHAKQRKFLT
jgi:hypothetical protein